MADEQSNHFRRNAFYAQMRRAINNGDLAKVSTRKCAHCDSTAEHYHHEDYTKPLEVTPLCNDCHRKVHGKGRKSGRKITLYLPDGFYERIEDCIELLAEEGVDVTDEKRGHPSISKMFRYLVDEALKSKIQHPE